MRSVIKSCQIQKKLKKSTANEWAKARKGKEAKEKEVIKKEILNTSKNNTILCVLMHTNLKLEKQRFNYSLFYSNYA